MKNNILIKIQKDPLAGFTKEELINALQLKLRNRVTEAYLFGSFFSEKFGENSDLDLLLIKNTRVPFLDRATEFFDILDLGPRFDILVYTPQEFTALISGAKTGFWKSVKETMRRIL